MRKVSFSEVSTYLECQAKWDLIYNKGYEQSNEHFSFGDIGHNVLYDRVIPTEELYPELKEFFNITSWNNYFGNVIETIDNILNDYDIIERELRLEDDFLKGIIDVLAVHKKTKRILILDYKFTTTRRTLNDIEIDSQLYIYSYLVHKLYKYENLDTSLNNIDIGIISIPKKEISEPVVLKNGKLSVSRTQNTTYELFIEKINELNLDVRDYEDFIDFLKVKKHIEFIKTTLNIELLKEILINIENVIKDMDKGYILKTFSYRHNDCLCQKINKEVYNE